jgi:hypothetical protein
MMRNTSINFGYDAINRPNALTQDMAGTAYDVTYGFGYNPASQITMRSMSNDAFVYTGDVNVIPIPLVVDSFRGFPFC